MAKKMTLLDLEPKETLHFCKTPMTTSPNRVLKLVNKDAGNVAFKVKTTAPKAYLVRPAAGTLKPRGQAGSDIEVQIILQSQGMEGSGTSHRFLVQATAVKDTEPVSREYWTTLPKDALQEQRLNVVLEEQAADQQPLEQDAGYEPNMRTGPGGSSEGQSDLNVKYDELVQYTLVLEKEKKKLETEIAGLKNAPANAAGEGFSKFTMLLAVLIAFLLPYAVNFATAV